MPTPLRAVIKALGAFVWATAVVCALLSIGLSPSTANLSGEELVLKSAARRQLPRRFESVTESRFAESRGDARWDSGYQTVYSAQDQTIHAWSLQFDRADFESWLPGADLPPYSTGVFESLILPGSVLVWQHVPADDGGRISFGSNEKSAVAKLNCDSARGPLIGCLIGDDVPVLDRLLEARGKVPFNVRDVPQTHELDVEVRTDSGDYVVRIDPARQFALTAARVRRSWNQQAYGRPLWQAMRPGRGGVDILPSQPTDDDRAVEQNAALDPIEVVETRDGWRAVSAHYSVDGRNGSGERFTCTGTIAQSYFREGEVDNDHLIIHAPDGVEAYPIDSQDGVPREWRNGKVAVARRDALARSLERDVTAESSDAAASSPALLHPRNWQPAIIAGLGLGAVVIGAIFFQRMRKAEGRTHR